MDTIKLWGRDGDAVRQAIELGELVHLDTAREELTDACLLFAIERGLLAKWAEAFPDPRCAPESRMEVIVASHLAARLAGLSSMRKRGYGLRSASVWGALGYRVEVLEPAQGLSLRGTSDATLLSGDVLRKRLVKLANHVAPEAPGVCRPLSRVWRSRCARGLRDGRSRARARWWRQRRVRSEWRPSWESGRTLTAGHHGWSRPALAQAVAALWWTPRMWRSPGRQEPPRAVGWCKTTTGAGQGGTHWPPCAPCGTMPG